MLVFVHGESWSWGSAALYDARILATLGRIIVVTFNYRLGVFGEISNLSLADKGFVGSARSSRSGNHHLSVRPGNKLSSQSSFLWLKSKLFSRHSCSLSHNGCAILGFLNTNPSPMTKGFVSNYGLVDQMAALQWVVENIEQFGGDPERITLMGQVGRGR